MYNRNYYLLNHNNGYLKYHELLKSFFLTTDPKPFFDKINNKEIESENQLLFFKFINKHFKNLKELVKEPYSLSTTHIDIITKIKNLDLNKLSRSEFILLVNRQNNLMIWITRYQRELELLAIKEKVYLNLLPLNNNKGTKRIANCLEYFSNKYQFSNADIIIRCSTDCCWLDNINGSYIFLPMVDYETLLFYFSNNAYDLS